MDSQAGWSGTVAEFLSKSPMNLRKELEGFVSALILPVMDPQRRAWADSIGLLRESCETLIVQHPEAAEWGLILEYELPRERGRRPDIVVHSGRSLGVVEFKGRSFAEQADVDQVEAYGRDIAEYHAASHNLRVERILSLDSTSAAPEKSHNT